MKNCRAAGPDGSRLACGIETPVRRLQKKYRLTNGNLRSILALFDKVIKFREKRKEEQS